MQQKNLFVFLFLSLLVLIGWSFLSNWLWPPPPRKIPEVRWENLSPRDKVAVGAVRLAAAPVGGWSGLDAVSWLATEAQLAELVPPPAAPRPKPPEVVWPWRRLPARDQGAIFTRLGAALPGAGLGLENAVGLLTEVALAANPPPRKIDTAQIGGDWDDPSKPGTKAFKLRALLTARGAGVQNLVLNDFKPADHLGKPTVNPDPNRIHPLNLIPDDPNPNLIPDDPDDRWAPSNVLYHYAVPGDDHPNNPEADLGELIWTLKETRNGPNEPEHRVVFTAEVPGQDVILTKTYTLKPGAYHLGLAIRMERKGASHDPIVKFRYQLTGAHGLPIEGEWYATVYHNAMIGSLDKSGNLWRDLQDSQKIGFHDGGQEVRPDDKSICYAGIATSYFASAIVVHEDHQKEGPAARILDWARPTVEKKRILDKKRGDFEKPFLDDITVRVISKPVELKQGQIVEHKYLLYNGPVKVGLLHHLGKSKNIDDALVNRYADTLHLKTLTDYARFGFWSDLLIACTNLMHLLLYYIHTYIMPWSDGLCIVLLTILIRGLMFPLSRKQTMAGAQMQEKMQKVNLELAPEIKKLEEKYKADPWALRQAKHELYMKKGVNPMAMFSTCWMMFAQLPIFLGLYYALQESIQFRLAPFLWIKNLAAPDMLYEWSEKIPVISTPESQGTGFLSFLYLGPFFNLLPIIWVVLMFFQQKIMTPPTADDQVKQQQKMMKYMLILFFFFFYKVPSGLCIYWIGSILWTLGERKLLPKRQPIVAGAAAAPAPNKDSDKPAPGRPKGRGASKGGKGKGKDSGPNAKQKVSNWWAEVLRQAKKK